MKLILTVILLLAIGDIWHDIFFVYDNYLYVRRWDLERAAMEEHKETGFYSVSEDWLYVDKRGSYDAKDYRIYKRFTTPKPGESLFEEGKP